MMIRPGVLQGSTRVHRRCLDTADAEQLLKAMDVATAVQLFEVMDLR